jgi:hypothetical protein
LRNHRVSILRGAVAVAAAMLARCPTSLGVSWNATVPADSAISSTGLTDQPTLFLDENVVTDTSNSTRGTGTYLGDGWVLTAQHVVDAGGTYGIPAAPDTMQYTISIGGITQRTLATRSRPMAAPTSR